MQSTESIYEALGRAIRTQRERREMTQGVLAERVGLSRASITNIELGRQSVLVDQLFRFAEALSMSPAELLSAVSIVPVVKEREPLSPQGEAWVERILKAHQNPHQ